VLETGRPMCVTTIASRSGFPTSYTKSMTVDDDDRPSWTWALAGFADGSMGIFDERVAGSIFHSFLLSFLPFFLLAHNLSPPNVHPCVHPPWHPRCRPHSHPRSQC